MKKNLSLLQALFAEYLGTLFLTLTAVLTANPFAVGLYIVAMVYTLGPISGCHLNPAVTVAFVTLRKMEWYKGLLYFVAQIAGAFSGVLVTVFLGYKSLPSTSPTALAEIIGFGILILTIAGVVKGKVPAAATGVAIGAGLTAALLATGGIINPAVALSFGEKISSPAIWAPFLSALLFSGVISFLFAKNEK